jgi:type IV pilus assembly protein PilV
MAKFMSVSSVSRMARKQDGFTLIEVFIAIVLLTVGLLGTAALTTGVVRGNVGSRNMTTATAIAQSCLEENRRVGYSSAGSVPVGGSNSCVTGNVPLTQGGVSFTRTLTVTPTPADTTNIRTLTVTVQWSEGAVGSKSITLKTILAAS